MNLAVEKTAQYTPAMAALGLGNERRLGRESFSSNEVREIFVQQLRFTVIPTAPRS
jgi:hypothetical protein